MALSTNDPLLPADAGIIKVFYNSEYTFSQRLYGELDVDLTHIMLQQPLGAVLRQAGIYLREALPLPCFQALMMLSEVW